MTNQNAIVANSSKVEPTKFLIALRPTGSFVKSVKSTSSDGNSISDSVKPAKAVIVYVLVRSITKS